MNEPVLEGSAVDRPPVAAQAEGEGNAPPLTPSAYAPRLFAGLPLSTLIVGLLVAALALWNASIAKQLAELRAHRTVSVSLATLVRGFVATEARSKSTPEEAARRSKAYLDATQGAMRSIASHNTTILLSEAVAGDSVPDITPQLAAVIRLKMEAVDHGR